MKTAELKELYQSADWKQEKHVPVIEIEGKAKKGEYCKVSVMIGKEIPHPNTTEHHIEWIDLYFMADGDKFPFQIGRLEFSSHGSSIQGPNTSAVYTNHQGCMFMKTDKPGTILASSYCNIHGLWKSEMRLELE